MLSVDFLTGVLAATMLYVIGLTLGLSWVLKEVWALRELRSWIDFYSAWIAELWNSRAHVRQLVHPMSYPETDLLPNDVSPEECFQVLYARDRYYFRRMRVLDASSDGQMQGGMCGSR